MARAGTVRTRTRRDALQGVYGPVVVEDSVPSMSRLQPCSEARDAIQGVNLIMHKGGGTASA